MSETFSSERLFDYGPQRSFPGSANQVAFLLGGIGAGNVSVGARGELRDWEIFGKPGKGNFIPNTFFAIHVSGDDITPVAKVLESQIHPPYSKPRGFLDHEAAGLPRFASSTAKGEYPFFRVHFEDPDIPARVELEAYTPLVPLDPDASGLPIAVLRYRVHNPNDFPIQVSVAGSMGNVTSLIDYHRHTWQWFDSADENMNEYRDDSVLRGLFFRPKSLSVESLNFGTMSLTTSSKEVTHKRSWLRGGWHDGIQDFWNDFCQDGRLKAESVYTQSDAKDIHDDQTGSLAIHKQVSARSEEVFEFQIAWHFPNRVRSWSRRMYDTEIRAKSDAPLPAGEYPTVRKRYAKFTDAWEVAKHYVINETALETASKQFHRAMFESSLPWYVIDAVTANIAAVRSSTCIWLEDGNFLAWEGCFDEEGSCEGTCTHVWNYAQTIAYLFPSLERQMRRNEYLVETNADGKMNFRSYQIWGMPGQDHEPAADGQLGTLIRLYREWLLSGDQGFLDEVWPAAKATLDFAFERWDSDGDFVLDRDQFNTYDINFHGPNSMVNSIFLAALRAGEKLAMNQGDHISAQRYRSAFAAGTARTDELLWGGSYYLQQNSEVNQYRYQYGVGCLSDQMFGQTLAHLVGLGYVLPKAHVAEAIKAVFQNNFRTSFVNHHNPQRTYALGDESGLVLCSWPRGGRPTIPFPYSDEVWTGVEYQVATNLIYEGLVPEALTLVLAVRERHDGVKRNPWNEAECGHHYARSLASYGLLVALSGFECDIPNRRLSFNPKIESSEFSTFFAAGTGWGIYRQSLIENALVQEIELLGGHLSGFDLPGVTVISKEN